MGHLASFRSQVQEMQNNCFPYYTSQLQQTQAMQAVFEAPTLLIILFFSEVFWRYLKLRHFKIILFPEVTSRVTLSCKNVAFRVSLS